MLDSPEEVEAWIAERKRRWPSAPRVEEKKRKMDEAVARGQLSLEDSGLAGRKRRRTDDGNAERGRGRTTVRARGRGRGVDAGWRGRGRGTAPQQQPRPPPPPSENSSSSGDSDDSNDDGAPEIVSSKSLSVAAPPPEIPPARAEVIKRSRLPQPKQLVHNPFASRPTLLRNVSLSYFRLHF
jgi:hypothetical protein